MTRKKVELAYISNDSSRKAAYNKRKKGLLKKANELSTLCGINAGTIIYSPYDPNPVVWPSNSGVHSVISEFKALPEIEKQKKMVDQESFTRQRITKAYKHVKTLRKENREIEMREVMHQYLRGNKGMFQLNIMDLNDLGYLIKQYETNLNRRSDILQNSGMEIGESSNAIAASSEGIGEMAAVTLTTAQTGVSFPSSTPAITNFLNSFHQQQMANPYVGLYQHPQYSNHNLSHSQNQQPRFMETISYPEQMSYMNEQMNVSSMYDNHRYQQSLSSDSSTALDGVRSSNIAPISGPNHTNNMFFP